MTNHVFRDVSNVVDNAFDCEIRFDDDLIYFESIKFKQICVLLRAI